MITVSMLSNLNSEIQEEAPFLRIVAERRDTALSHEFTYFNIRLQKSKYIDVEYHPLNVTNELKEDIEMFLKNEGITNIAWNNNYTTFWE